MVFKFLAAFFITLLLSFNLFSEEVSINLAAEKIKFGQTGIKTLQGTELKASPAFGNMVTGKHGTFIKFPSGGVSVLHIHTDDYYAVVLEGVGANGLPGSKDVRLNKGSYWFQKGGEAHITKCLSKTDCLFFVSQSGKFDYIPQHK